jgi:predicted dithiol-disulfide oxidoreductase (DUF899 family)
MSKKTKKLKDILALLANSDGYDVYHLFSDSGDDFKHEYTIKIKETESGTMYSMEYSNSSEWSDEIRGVNVFNMLNTGNGFKWVDTLPNLSFDYAQMYELQVFLRFIQDIEASSKYTTKILKVKEVSTYNF